MRRAGLSYFQRNGLACFACRRVPPGTRRTTRPRRTVCSDGRTCARPRGGVGPTYGRSVTRRPERARIHAQPANLVREPVDAQCLCSKGARRVAARRPTSRSPRSAVAVAHVEHEPLGHGSVAATPPLRSTGHVARRDAVLRADRDVGALDVPGGEVDAVEGHRGAAPEAPPATGRASPSLMPTFLPADHASAPPLRHLTRASGLNEHRRRSSAQSLVAKLPERAASANGFLPGLSNVYPTP